MEQTAKWARTLSNRLEWGLNWAVIFFTAMMLIVALAGIISRAGFNAAFAWSEELGRYTMIYAGCLGISLALKRGLHVGISIIVKRLPPNIAIICDIIARVLIAIFLLVMIIQGIKVCQIVSMQTSPTMGFNMVWVFMITPITAFLQIVFLALMTIEDLAGGMWGKSLVTRPHDIEFG